MAVPVRILCFHEELTKKPTVINKYAPNAFSYNVAHKITNFQHVKITHLCDLYPFLYTVDSEMFVRT